MSDIPHVQLGTHSVPVYPQKVGRVLNRMGWIIELLAGADTMSAAPAQILMQVGGEGAYALLSLCVPNVEKHLPEWEFRGYASKERYDAGEYDDALDNSPEIPEVLTAIETSFEVNRLFALAEKMRGANPPTPPTAAAVSTVSATPPAPNGGSPVSTSSTTSPPTSTVNGD